MKRLITLLMVAVMMFAVAFSANAETLTKGINVNFVEDAEGIITTTVSAVGLEKLASLYMGIKFDTTKVALMHSDKATTATTTSKFADVVTNVATTISGWAGNTFKIGADFVTLNNFTADNAYAYNCTESTDLYTLYFKKVAGKTIDESTFTIYYKAAGGQTGYQEAGSTKVKANVPGTFGFTVTPYTAPGGETWQDTIDTKLPTGDVIKFPATKDKIGGTEADLTADDTAKKVVIFAKNTSSDALVGSNNGQTANYGITIGGMFYPGFLDVPTGANWSIILVDPNGTLTGSYTASATVGSETKPLSNVSFE